MTSAFRANDVCILRRRPPDLRVTLTFDFVVADAFGDLLGGWVPGSAGVAEPDLPWLRLFIRCLTASLALATSTNS